ncbi:MAG: phosphorylase family protein [Alphaproteobacteria bacterium]
MSTDQDIAGNVALLDDRSGGLKPRVGIVLGSGLGPIADDVANATIVPYGDLHGFPSPGVGGHVGRLLLGAISDTPVAVLHGRAHYYESGRADAMKGPVRTLSALGCEALILTNAAGSLREEVGPIGMALHEGVYAWFCGPHFETPAEIRAARVLGADAVGMSTAPECILARHTGMRVAALSIVTNLAAGMDDTGLSHDQTLAVAATAAGDVRKLLLAFLKDWPV